MLFWGLRFSSQKNRTHIIIMLRKQIFHYHNLLTYLVRRTQRKTLFVLFLELHPGFHLPSNIPQQQRSTFVKFFPARLSSDGQLLDLWRGWYFGRIPTYQTEIYKFMENSLWFFFSRVILSLFWSILGLSTNITLNHLNSFAEILKTFSKYHKNVSKYLEKRSQ